jgi:hypothetical protein
MTSSLESAGEREGAIQDGEYEICGKREKEKTWHGGESVRV